MAPQAKDKKRRALAVRVIFRYGLIVIAASLFLTTCIYASQRFEQFLIRDPRFLLPGPADYGLESANLEVHGVKYASRAQILRIFEPDMGRSIFLFPLKARRKALLNVRWVRDAAIERIWPNRIQVRIEERHPAAFVKLRAESMERWALIDEDGVILDPPLKAGFHLPMLAGVNPDESAAQRGMRVRRAERLMQELGNLADKISEADVSDLDDLKITQKLDGRAVTLMLGERNFTSRLQNFLDHYPDIHRRIPQVTTFDLRLDDRITGVAAAN
jgi:cell division protein FtsQ